jgi:hypothetical protein
VPRAGWPGLPAATSGDLPQETNSTNNPSVKNESKRATGQ